MYVIVCMFWIILEVNMLHQSKQRPQIIDTEQVENALFACSDFSCDTLTAPGWHPSLECDRDLILCSWKIVRVIWTFLNNVWTSGLEGGKRGAMSYQVVGYFVHNDQIHLDIIEPNVVSQSKVFHKFSLLNNHTAILSRWQHTTAKTSEGLLLV